MNKIGILILGTSLAWLSLGCSGIRVVRESKNGGEIALIGDRMEAMQMAEQEMGRVCGGPGSFEIVEQGEFVVGSVTTTETHIEGGEVEKSRESEKGHVEEKKTVKKESTDMTTTTETSDKVEWRVKYICKRLMSEEPQKSPAPQSRVHEFRMRF